MNLTSSASKGLKEGLEDLFLYQTDLLENTPGDPGIVYGLRNSVSYNITENDYKIVCYYSGNSSG